MLNIGGKCAVVLPDGQDLFSKSNTTLVAVREYLMKTCDLKEIYYLPSGIFTNTTIKTCVFYFVKKREGTDVLEVKTNVSKTQKETGRDYRFSKTHQTTKVAFYDYNPYEGEGVKNLLVEVPIDKIMNNSYSLNYTEYIKDDAEEEYEDGIVVKTLGEVCKDISTSKNIPSSDRIDGIFRFFTCSREETTHNEHHYDGTFIIHGSRGSTIKESIFMTNNEKFAIGTSMFISEVKNRNECVSKYIYYYLRLNKSIFNKYINGTAIPMISKSNYYDIKIPIPSLERQKEIVKYLDFVYEKSIKTSNEKIAELKQLNEFCLNNQKRFGENVVKELGDISLINPENIKSGQYTEINYIDIASVKGGQILELQKLTNDFPSRAKRIVKKGDILYSSVRPNLKGYVYISDDIQNSIASTGFANIRVKESNIILSKYLYYIMTCDFITDELISKAKGAQYPVVSFDDFETLKIPIPSLELQKEIVLYCEFNDMLIQQLEKEIENNKKQAQQFIDCILKSQLQIEED